MIIWALRDCKLLFLDQNLSEVVVASITLYFILKKNMVRKIENGFHWLVFFQCNW